MSPEKKKSKRQLMREKRRRKERSNRLIAVGLMVVGAIFVAFLLIIPSMRTDVQFESRPFANDNVMGDPDAPITVTEYSDYKCGHCGSFAAETEPLLVEQYIKTGTVRFVYRSMGSWLSDQSAYAIEASYCAGEENKFWEFHDVVFSNQMANFDLPTLTSWARTIGLDTGAFRECMNEHRYQARAEQDGTDGNALGVSGTPTFFLTYSVNGEDKTRMIQGAQPFESFQREIESALAEMGL